MSEFTDPLVVQKVVDVQHKKFLWMNRKVVKHWWVVAKPFKYHVGSEASSDIIRVPKGYKTDFASVPRMFWRICPPDGVYTQAAVVHDYACENQRDTRSQKEIDLIFLEAMEVLEVPKWKRVMMHRAVEAAQRLKCIKEGRNYGKPNKP